MEARTPEAPLTVLHGISQMRAEAFAACGVHTLRDLTAFYPRAYELRGRVLPLSAAAVAETSAHIVTVQTQPVLQHFGKKSRVLCTVADDSAQVLLCYFNMPYRKKQLEMQKKYRIYGRCSMLAGKKAFVNPHLEPYTEQDPLPAIVPVYPERGALTQSLIRNAISQALGIVYSPENAPADPLPLSLRTAYGLASQSFAVRCMHQPLTEQELAKARRRIIFEELFCYGLQLYMHRNGRMQLPGIRFTHTDLHAFYDALPFSPTAAQRRVLAEFAEDFSIAAHPMQRLLSGDVGSGKTLCAAAAAYMAVNSGYQCVLMAPTELLARQHADTLERFLGCFGISPKLLVGSMSAAEKCTIRQAFANGTVSLAVGTHALLEDTVQFAKLGLVITDEQQRFGVLQRQLLADKAARVHVLMMTATPIPRTMQQLLFGDMDSSVLDELPPGRKPVSTHLITPQRREDLLLYLHKQALAGRQIFVVCPTVEHGEGENDLLSAQACARDLKERMGEVGVGIIHGRMKGSEKEAVMQAFTRGELHILVSTTVIETGVDVPAATIMVIENAERFGLSQLHQLRGRVGRGSEKSYCFLVSAAESESARQRLQIVCQQSDGFAIANEDLRLRGPGDYVSAVRQGGVYPQSGALQFVLADPERDMELLQQALAAAKAFLAEDPLLALPQHRVLRARICGENLQAASCMRRETPV